MTAVVSVIIGCMAGSINAAPAPEGGRAGATLYVSRFGDNSDGRSWATAFTSIQAALLAVPDAEGGHRVIIRPDTYFESNLYPAHKGAPGAYNTIEGDFDGQLGSGATGWVVIDSGSPDMIVRTDPGSGGGNPGFVVLNDGGLEAGLKSIDWWGPWRCAPNFSAIGWDRWIYRHLYMTGAEGGIGWDLTIEKGAEFTAIVEDCVGIGRAFGGVVGAFVGREQEPVVFRRCELWSLDWWGDASGMYVRSERDHMPDFPDVVMEDCTMVGPQCALKVGNPGFDGFSRIQLKNCRLAALNFSQPVGTPTDGIIQSVMDGKLMHIDIEDCTLMGYKVFGVRHAKETEKDITYTTKGSVRAYVQFQQSVPEGFLRIAQWPSEVFQSIVPPEIPSPGAALEKGTLIRKDMCELSPLIWRGRLCHMECVRPGGGGTKADYYLLIKDAETGEELSRFAEGYSLACVHVQDDVIYAFASRYEPDHGPWNDVTLFKSSDLEHWESKVVIIQENESIFNSSVCAGPDGYVMAYESNDGAYPQFTIKFARSQDLENWTKLDTAVLGTDRYTACPCIRYANGYYYVLYTEHRQPRWFFEVWMARSKDLEHWELSTANPVLTPDELDEGIDASDPDLVEWNGQTYLYYSVGDQLTWMNIKRAVYPGRLADFLEYWFRTPGVEDRGTAAVQHAENAAKAERQAWFNEAKFGMFIHWGLYSTIAKNDKGPYVSWVMANEGIPVEEYEKQADVFQPAKFDAAQWMAIAKNAGARYVTFTSKHHEGFCQFDTELTDYNSVSHAAKTDFTGALIEAAHAAGLKICLYHSMLDWHHPDYKPYLPKYVEYLHAQVRELCTNYGPIDGIWFDGEWDYPAETWRAAELVRMIRALQPNAVVNDRLGKGLRGVTRLCDFFTREQPDEIDKATEFEREKPYPWEACMTIGTSWGYRADDTAFKSAEELIRALVNVAGRGGNLLLNVGPKPDGEIPAEFVARLEAIGAWLDKNGESIYGTSGSPFASLPAGTCTTKGSRLYVHLESHPGAPLALPGLENEIRRAWFLETDQDLAFDNETKTILLPETRCDEVVTTVAVELDGPPRVGAQ